PVKKRARFLFRRSKNLKAASVGLLFFIAPKAPYSWMTEPKKRCAKTAKACFLQALCVAKANSARGRSCGFAIRMELNSPAALPILIPPPSNRARPEKPSFIGIIWRCCEKEIRHQRPAQDHGEASLAGRLPVGSRAGP